MCSLQVPQAETILVTPVLEDKHVFVPAFVILNCGLLLFIFHCFVAFYVLHLY